MYVVGQHESHLNYAPPKNIYSKLSPSFKNGLREQPVNVPLYHKNLYFKNPSFEALKAFQCMRMLNMST